MKNQSFIKNIQKTEMYSFLITLTIVGSAGLQSWRTLFNNFAVDELNIGGFWVGAIQSVREIPGFLALLVIFLLKVIPEHKLSSYSIILMGTGIFITGASATPLSLVLATFIMSTGFHYYETTCKSQVLQYFDRKGATYMLARLKSITSLANILAGALIWMISDILHIRDIFYIAGIAIIIFGIKSLRQNPVDRELSVQSKNMVVKKKYWLFYLLNFFAGARRQIFVVFAVFLMVEKYSFSVQTITLLFLVNNLINYFLAPMIGKLISRYGERPLLSVEYFSLIFVFLGYAFIKIPLAAVILYILDHVFFNFAIAINTYFHKTAEPQDIAPSMAVSFTINHIAAVVLPLLGGILWTVNPSIPFITGAVLSLVSLFFVQFIKTGIREEPQSENREQ